MKRTWAAIIMVAVLLALCTIVPIFTHQNIASLTDKINEAKTQTSQGNIEEVKRLSQEISLMWNDHYQIFCTYISHEKLEAIDQSIATLQTNLEYEEYSEFTAELDRACSQLKHLQDTEMPVLENIL